MTTIACNRESIACDLQVTSGNTRFKVKTKIFSFDPHERTYNKPFMVGYCGEVEQALDVIDWLTYPDAPIPRRKKVEFLVLTQDKKIFTFYNPTQWIEFDEPSLAIGSGADYALAAMRVGKTPKEAVEVAAKLDIKTGMGIREYSW